MNEKTIFAAIAGLLHDIGKLEQRARVDPWNPPSDVTGEGQPIHAAWSMSFIQAYVQPALRPAALAGAYHHHPERNPGQDKSLSELVALADKLSAGERADEEEKGKRNPPRQMVTIFDRLSLQGGSHKSGWHYLPLQPLHLKKESIFPQPVEGSKEGDRYNNLCEGMRQAANNHNDNPQIYLENLLAAMQQFTWCVPSAYYYSIPDVSLYDHSRMTAAMAVCLAEKSPTEIQTLLAAVTRKFHQQPGAEDDAILEQPVALLVGGDISGIQDFIYTISAKGATPTLRGRSFYLQLLTEAVVRFILREFELPYTNLIYGGGGNFYLLARVNDNQKISALRKKLSRILYKHHQGDLYVAISTLPLKAKNFLKCNDENKPHPLSKKWRDLADRLVEAKNSRFSELNEEELRRLFDPDGHGGNEEKQCQVCGREHPETRKIEVGHHKESIRKCPTCLSFEKLGDELRQAQFIEWHFHPHPNNIPPLSEQVTPGSYMSLFQEMGFNIKVTDTMSSGKSYNHIWALNDNAFEQARQNAGSQTLYRRMLVNVTPIISPEEIRELQGNVEDLPDEKSTRPVKPFGALAYQTQGIHRLGVFRADVDNLGKLFEKGLGKYATLSRIASLSFAINLFFEGWVGEIAKEHNEKRRQEDQKGNGSRLGDALYAIYSGGDDLFFVGSWDVLVEFALKVNQDLKEFTGEHPDIHISGGLVLVTDKYPLAKAANDALIAEKLAKNLHWWDDEGQKHEKDAFTFLGHPLPWYEFQNAHDLKGRLAKLIDSKRSSIIQKILMNYFLYSREEEKRFQAGKDKKNIDQPQTLYGPWNWRICYLLRRNFGKEIKDNSEEQRLMTDFHVLPNQQLEPNFARLNWVGVAARWTELLNRKKD